MLCGVQIIEKAVFIRIYSVLNIEKIRLYKMTQCLKKKKIQDKIVEKELYLMCESCSIILVVVSYQTKQKS